MEILNQFGFDVRLFSAQIINFLIIVFVFKRFLYKPLLKTLKQREDKISQGIKDAEKANKALEDAETGKEEILKKASLEAEKITTQAKSEAETIKVELMDKTKNEVENIINQAKEQMAQERDHMISEAKNISLSIAQEVLQKTISNMFDKEDQDKLMKKSIQKIKNEQTKN